MDQNSLQQVMSTFQNMIDGVISAYEPLRESAQIVIDESVKNIDTQGFTYGTAFAPLAVATRADRVRKGFPAARPILKRTGTLRDGAMIKSITDQEVVVENPVPYAVFHQNGTRKMPKREVLSTTDKIEKAINLVFGNYIGRLISK